MGWQQQVEKANRDFLKAQERMERAVEKTLDNVARKVESGAKRRVPTWKRILQSSIETRTPEQFRRQVGYFDAHTAQIGAFQEYGTARHGAQTLPSGTPLPPEYRHGGSHKMPPGDALEEWALDHGFSSGYQVAKIIYKNQGVPAVPSLYPAAEDQRKALADEVANDLKKAA